MSCCSGRAASILGKHTISGVSTERPINQVEFHTLTCWSTLQKRFSDLMEFI